MRRRRVQRRGVGARVGGGAEGVGVGRVPGRVGRDHVDAVAKPVGQSADRAGEGRRGAAERGGAVGRGRGVGEDGGPAVKARGGPGDIDHAVVGARGVQARGVGARVGGGADCSRSKSYGGKRRE